MQQSFFEPYKIPGLHLTILLLAAVLVSAIAWPFHFYFLNDDLIHIPLAASGKIGHHNSIRYLGDFSLMLDAALFGKKAFGYHFTNLLLHLLNMLLLWKILFTFFLPARNDIKNYLVLYPVILFACFGFHSDAIFWVIGRSASLGCFFFLLTVYCLQNSEKGMRYKGGALFFWIAALFSYESVWIFPIILLAAYIIFRSAPLKIKMMHPSSLFFFWGSFAGYLIFRKITTTEWLGSYEASSIQSFNIGRLVINYCKLLSRTTVPPNNDSGQFVLYAAIALIIIASLIAMVVVRKLYNKNWMFFLFCWLISYMPYVSLGISTISIESERFLYLPSLFFSIWVIYSMFLLLKYHQKLFHLLAIAVIIFNVVYFIKASGIYRQSGNLVEETFSILGDHQPIQKLEIKNLPLTIHGIPVFRSGFEEGYHWLVNPATITKIEILDSIENVSLRMMPEILNSQEKSILKFRSIKP